MVDWAFDACTHPLTAQRQNIGRKIVGKTAPPELVPKGRLAVCPEALPEFRLSRELGAPVFGLNLGARNPKPARLEPLAFPTAPSTMPSLTMILGKEDGVTYHVESPTAVKILQVAKSQQEASGPPRLGSLFWSLHPGPFSRDRGPRHIFLSTLLPLSWPGRSAGYKGGSRPFSRHPSQRRRTEEENQQRGGRGPRKRQQSTKKNVCVWLWGKGPGEDFSGRKPVRKAQNAH